MSHPQALLCDALEAHFSKSFPARMAVAVSGGSDSTALLLGLKDWAQGRDVSLYAVTVDHGLRAASTQEAEAVARLCAELGLPHHCLVWQGWDGQGNLSDAARRARYDLMADWALGHEIHDLVLGHTQNDQAETLVMRLARGAGLDGLAGMGARTARGAMTLHRPLLGVSRESLRAYLRQRDIGWADDPSNDDPQYARVRTRAALAALESAGVEIEALAKVAGYLREARETISHVAQEAAERLVQFDLGDLVIDAQAWGEERKDIQRRILQAALRWVSGHGYPARGAAVEALLEAVQRDEATTLHGCRIIPRRDYIRITREWAAVADLEASAGTLWDGRWQVSGPFEPEDRIRALGEASLALCPDRRQAGYPAASLIASPAVWRDGQLIAAPLAGLGQSDGWSAECLRSRRDLNDTLLSH